MSYRLALVTALLAALVGCDNAANDSDANVATADKNATGTAVDAPETPPMDGSAAPPFLVDTYVRHIRTLSSDEFEGRSPNSAGETKTINYLQDEFKKLGVEPGNGDSFFQDVPLVSMIATPQPLVISKDGEQLRELQVGPDTVLWTKRVTESAELTDSELVFVGYGAVAPEYNWNDYEGIDMTGKTAVILVNDPGYATQDPELFNGNAMTYYGRWTYKFEEAARQGAAGALVIHETAPAAYGWDVVEGSWTGAQHDLVTADRNMGRAAIEGWITNSQADAILQAGGIDYASAKEMALKDDFRPVPLGVTASTSLTNSIRTANSKNVIGMIKGSERPDEVVLYMAHWDHLGQDESLQDDQIYNGAVDNATGTAGLLMIAEAFMKAEKKPERSTVFIAVTAEESGLLGSKHYGENPVFPLNKTIAGINMDALSVAGRAKDVAVVGFGNSELEDYLREAAAAQDRVIVPEPTPEKGYFYRSDHLMLAKQGVPMLYAKSGQDLREGGAAAGKAADDDYRQLRYHRPADEYDPSWFKVDGAMEDLELYYVIGNRIANEEDYVNWYDGNEFKAIRDASLSNQ